MCEGNRSLCVCVIILSLYSNVIPLMILVLELRLKKENLRLKNLRSLSHSACSLFNAIYFLSAGIHPFQWVP